jgi:hypothetical protein
MAVGQIMQREDVAKAKEANRHGPQLQHSVLLEHALFSQSRPLVIPGKVLVQINTG